MTLAEVIALINSDIVPNGNNEITANVLRPILIEMLQQPNDLIGDLGDLNTDESDTLVDAINSINNALSAVDGFVILSGQGDPNQQSFPSLSIADLYSEIDGLGSPLALWIYDGTKFIRLSDKYLSYEIPQSLTPTEQLTARTNIGAVGTDGSNTTGGEWKIESLTSDDVGNYINTYEFTNDTLGVPSTSVLGATSGVMLMRGGAPIAISENTDTDWDGYIYRAGLPNSGYPDHAKTGNYLIESKHRFRTHQHNTLDDLDAGVGKVILNPYNAIEHQYFDVNIIEAMDSLEIDIQSPEQDEITGFAIERNTYGQRISVNINANAEVIFTNVQGVSFPNGGQSGVYKYIWDGVWLFDGYSPNEF